MDEAYCRYGKKHYDKLFLTEDWVLNKSIGEAHEASTPPFEEGGRISCEVRSVNFAPLCQHLC